MNLDQNIRSASKPAKVRRWASSFGVVALLLNMITGPATAGTYDDAMGRTKYVAMTGDVNGDGQNDVLMKAVPKIVLIPLDDDLSIPIPIPVPSPTFALISISTGGYTLVVNPGAEVLASVAWTAATQQVTFAGASGSVAASVTITAASNDQASFVVSMAADTGLLQLTSTTAPVWGATASSATPIAVVVDVPHLSNPDAGSLPGSLSVGNDGAATYSIPLAVPPGTGGMALGLSLNYSSNGGNGMIGLGWSLGGLSTIHRCTKTVAQDGVAGRISFDNADRLCLDGQRLVRVDGANPGSGATAIDTAYWAAGAEYRTERETFARITRLQDGSFKVEAKDGHIQYYGKYRNDAGSTIVAQGRTDSQPLLWALGATEDRSGNYLAVDYTQDATTGEYLPSQMRYGGNGPANQATDLAVRFSYEARGDAQTMYMGGSRNDMRNRLTHIKTYTNTAADGSGGTLVRDHTVHYVDSISSGRSLVDWMQACATNPKSSVSECLPKTTFDLGSGGALALAPLAMPAVMLPVLDQSVTYPSTGYLQPARYQGDLDGSGRTSFIVNRVTEYASLTVLNKLRIKLPNGVEFDHLLNTVAAGFSSATAAVDIRLGDLDGDGRDDFVLLGRNGDTGKWGYCMNAAAADGTVNFNCRPAPAGYVHAIVDLRNERKMHVISTLDLTSHAIADCFYVAGAMKCDPLPVRAIPSPTVAAMPMPGYNDIFSLASISLSRQGMSDFIATWETKVLAADPAHGYKIYDDASNTTYKMYDFSAGTASCFYLQNTLACQSVYNQIIPGDQAIRLSGSDPNAMSYRKYIPAMVTGQTVGDLNGDGLTDFAYGIREDSYIRPEMPETYATIRAASLCFSKESGMQCEASPVIQAGLLNNPMPAPNSTSVAGQIGDFRGDGVQRIILHDGDAAMKLCRYAGTVLTCQPFPNGIAANVPQMLSLNHGGVPAFLTGCDNRQTQQNRTPCTAVSLAAPAAADKVTGVTNGVGQREEVDYARGDDGDVYSRLAMKNGVDQQIAYPQVAARPGVMVKQLRRSTGSGTLRKTNQYYDGAMSDALGRGSLGFATVVSTDDKTKIATRKAFLQVWPYAGMESSSLVSAGGVNLSEASMVYGLKTTTHASGATTVFPVQLSGVIQRWDLGGQDLGTETTTGTTGGDIAYDDWGNQTASKVASSSGGDTFTTTTTNSFFGADTAHWLPPLLKRSDVANTDVSTAVAITRGVAYTYQADYSGRVKTETVQPDDTTKTMRIVTSYDLNKFGQVTDKTVTWFNPKTGLDNVKVDTTGYDARGRFALSFANALGHTETRIYDAGTGAQNSVTGPNKLATIFENDGFGQLRVQRSANGTETRMYKKLCQGDCVAGATVVEVVERYYGTNRIASPQVKYSDSAGHPLRTQTWAFDGTVIHTDKRYDELGRLWEEDQPHFSGATAYLGQRFKYDIVNRVVGIDTQTDSGEIISATTDYQGLTTVVTNAKSQKRTDVRDVRGRVKTVTDAASGITSFEYDPWGNLTKTTDPRQNVVTVSYNALGRRIELKDPDLGLIEYMVDASGLVWKQINPVMRAKGWSTTMEYDLLGRMTARLEPDLKSHWVFDTADKGVGMLAEAYTGTAALKDYVRTHTYDGLGRPSVTTQSLRGGTYSSLSEYDAWGRPIRITMRRGSHSAKVFDQRYNGFGYLARLERGGGSCQ